MGISPLRTEWETRRGQEPVCILYCHIYAINEIRNYLLPGTLIKAVTYQLAAWHFCRFAGKISIQPNAWYVG